MNDHSSLTSQYNVHWCWEVGQGLVLLFVGPGLQPSCVSILLLVFGIWDALHSLRGRRKRMWMVVLGTLLWANLEMVHLYSYSVDQNPDMWQHPTFREAEYRPYVGPGRWGKSQLALPVWGKPPRDRRLNLKGFLFQVCLPLRKQRFPPEYVMKSSVQFIFNVASFHSYRYSMGSLVGKSIKASLGNVSQVQF